MRYYKPSERFRTQKFRRRNDLLRWLKNRSIENSYNNDDVFIYLGKHVTQIDCYTMKWFCSCGCKKKGKAKLNNHLKEHILHLKEIDNSKRTIIRKKGETHGKSS